MKHESESKKIFRFIGFFIIFNVILWVGQEAYYFKDSSKIRSINKELKQERTQIEKNEALLSLNQTDFAKESYNPFNYFDSETEEYNYYVQKHNDIINEYKNSIETYNTKIDTVNELIAKSGSRWYLIPIPFMGNTHKAAKIN